MSIQLFLSSVAPTVKNDFTVNASGTVEFYSPNTAFSTASAVYADSGLTTSLGSIITLDSAGTKVAYLNGNYDIKIKDSSGSLIRTVTNINPDSSITAATAIQLIVNGSFESVTNNLPSNWVLFEWNSGANTVDNTSGNQTHGTYSMKFVTSGSGGGYITSADYFTVNPLKSIDISFSIKSSVANILNKVDILWYNYDKSANATPSTNLYSDSTTNPTSWTKFTKNTTPPSGAVYAKLKITGGDSSNANSGSVWFDNINALQDEILIGGDNTMSGSLVVGSPSGGSKGAGSINTQSLYINGAPLSGTASVGGLIYAFKQLT